MSAISVCIAENGIVFASDGAGYGPDGTVLGFASKLHSSPRNDFMFGHVGIANFGCALREEIGNPPPFDDLLESIVEASRNAYEVACGEWQHNSTPPRATLIIGGWSASRSGFEGYKLHSSEKPIVDSSTGETTMSQPWQLIPVAGLWCSSIPREQDLKKFGIDWKSDYSLLDMPARVVCANRAGSGDRGDGMYGVGGFLEMAVLAGNNIVRWIAHEWPDLIGEPIDPTRGDAMPPFPLSVPTA